MSVLDINSALTSGQTAIVDRLDITTPNGTKLRAKPRDGHAAAGRTIGVTCPAAATGLAYVAYPSCHAVAAIDTATGIVQQAITFDASGVPTIVADGNISCPDECAGAPVTAGTRPVALSPRACSARKQSATGRVPAQPARARGTRCCRARTSARHVQHQT